MDEMIIELTFSKEARTLDDAYDILAEDFRRLATMMVKMDRRAFVKATHEGLTGVSIKQRSKDSSQF
jgi:hypothetical protein